MFTLKKKEKTDGNFTADLRPSLWQISVWMQQKHSREHYHLFGLVVCHVVSKATDTFGKNVYYVMGQTVSTLHW